MINNSKWNALRWKSTMDICNIDIRYSNKMVIGHNIQNSNKFEEENRQKRLRGLLAN